MTILTDIPDANGPVLQESPACAGNNYKLARRAVNEAISDISEFLTDDEVAEVADALHGLVDQWQSDQPTL